MNSFRIFAAIVITLIGLVSLGVAQTPTTSPTPDEKQKKLDEAIVKMLDQSVSDATGLRLAEIRAIVFGLAGDIYWKYDNKRVRELFRNSAAEMISYNSE